jgi:hypothetical protein
VRKPLEPSVGGAGHMGVDSLGRNVYATRADPGWRAIAAWAGVLLDPIDAGPARDAGAIDGASDASIAPDAAEDAP